MHETCLYVFYKLLTQSNQSPLLPASLLLAINPLFILKVGLPTDIHLLSLLFTWVWSRIQSRWRGFKRNKGSIHVRLCATRSCWILDRPCCMKSVLSRGLRVDSNNEWLLKSFFDIFAVFLVGREQTKNATSHLKPVEPVFVLIVQLYAKCKYLQYLLRDGHFC